VSVRSVSVVLAVAALVAGCSGGDDGDSTPTRPETTTETKRTAETSCAPRLIWKKVEYLGNDVRLPAQVGEPLGRARIPPCEPAGSGQTVQIARIEGVDPAVAVVEAEDVFDVWVADTARARAYPPALERILYGPACDESEPFTLAGRWTGVSNPDEPLSVQLDTDSEGPRPAYRGLVIDIVVRDSTAGLNTRDAFSELELDRTRLRVRVRCTGADRPDRTFLAESIATTTGG
jgi:hypothetical protein